MTTPTAIAWRWASRPRGRSYRPAPRGGLRALPAARTDPDLQACPPILLAHAEREFALARQIFPRLPTAMTSTPWSSSAQHPAGGRASWALPGEAGTRELAFLTQLIRREPVSRRRPGGAVIDPIILLAFPPSASPCCWSGCSSGSTRSTRATPWAPLRQPVHGQRLRAPRYGLKLVIVGFFAWLYQFRLFDLFVWWTWLLLLFPTTSACTGATHGPRGAPDVVRPPQPPQLRALQPVHGAAAVLDRAAGPPAVLGPAAPAGLPRRDDHHPDGPEPAVPVLAAHRAHRRHGALRVAVQHPGLPPGAPRPERAIPRPQLRGHLHPLGPDLRHLRAGGRGRRLRRDHPHRLPQPFYIASWSTAPGCGTSAAPEPPGRPRLPRAPRLGGRQPPHRAGDAGGGRRRPPWGRHPRHRGSPRPRQTPTSSEHP